MVNKVNRLNRKHYLNQTSRLWGLALLGLTAAGAVGWIWRTDLAESSVQSFLRERGIEGGISFTKLSVNQASIRDLRLGPANNPTLLLPQATFSWHVDVTSGRLVIDRLEAQGAHLHIGMTQSGEPDFGALKPFLIPSDKPSQVQLGAVFLRNTRLSYDSPLGRGTALIQAHGGDQQGWRAHVLVTLPKRVVASVADQPLAIGLALRPDQRDQANQRAPSVIGLAMRPNGQSLQFGEIRVAKIKGQAQALLVLDGQGGTELTTSGIALTAERAVGGGLTLDNLSVTGGPGRWQHWTSGNQKWSETGFGTLFGRIEAKNVRTSQSNLARVSVDVSTARTKTGLTRIDIKGAATEFVGAPSLGWQAGAAQITGFAQTVLTDLQAASRAQWDGQTQVTWTNLVAQKTAKPDALSGQAGLAFVYGPEKAEVRVSGPLDLALRSGPKLRFTPDAKRPPLIRVDLTAAGAVPREALGAGDFAIQAPNAGKGQGRLEDFSWNPAGWTLAARALSLKNVPLPGTGSGFLISGQVGDMSLAAKTGGVPIGFGRGTLEVAGSAGAAGLGLGAGRAKLSGQIRGDGQTLLISLAGPVDGFGKGGPGVRQGRLTLDATARKSQAIWTVDLDSEVSAAGFRAPDLTFLDLKGRLKGQARLSPPSGQTATTLSGLSAWDANLTFTGAIDRLAAHNLSVGKGVINLPIVARGRDGAMEGSGAITLSAQKLGFDTSFAEDVRADLPLQFWAGEGQTPAWRATADVTASATSFTSGESIVEGLSVKGPISAVPGESGVGILLRGDTCLAVTAERGRFPGDASVGAVKTSFCPDRLGRFASLSGDSTIIFADARFEPLELRLGAMEDGRSLRLGAVRGDFRPAAKGGWQLDLTSQEVGYTFKLPDGGLAELYAQDSLLRLTPDPSGMALKGQLAGLRAKGLPVQISGTATADLQARRDGLVGGLAFENLLVRDVPTFFPVPDEAGTPIERPARFGMLSLTGEGTINGSQIDIQSDISLAESGAFLARAILNHNAQTGLGRLDALAETISFGQTPKNAAGVEQEGRRPLDADDIIPSLQGVILDIIGDVSGSASMAWGPNQATVSDAKLSTSNLDFMTLLGQVTNLTGDFSLADLLRVRSDGQQSFTVAQFDPGLPIQDVNVVFALPGNNTLDLSDASWPFADGKLSVRPASWTFRDGDQSFAVDVEDVDLAKFLGLTKIPNLQVDGRVSGVFPIEVRNGSVEIVGGKLQARDGGGKIRYTGPVPGSDPKTPKKKTPWYRNWFAPKQLTPEEIAAQALTGIEYEIEVITVDGRITGDLVLGVVLVGANPQILSGVPIKLNVKATLPVGQITDMANRFLETATSADMLKELDALDRSQNGKGFLPTPEEDKAAQSQP